jgi:hypothetical protein
VERKAKDFINSQKEKENAAIDRKKNAEESLRMK